MTRPKCEYGKCLYFAEFNLVAEARSVIFSTRQRCCKRCLARAIREVAKLKPLRISVTVLKS